MVVRGLGGDIINKSFFKKYFFVSVWFGVGGGGLRSGDFTNCGDFRCLGGKRRLNREI